MKLQQIVKGAITIDFETEPIENRPDYPPKPVGVCVRWGSHKPKYLTGQAMVKEVRRAFHTTMPLLFHNAPFDIEVAVVHCKVRRPKWGRVHDTLPMLFLLDPHADSFGLKLSSERYLGMEPAERDAVIDWLVKHQPVKGVKLNDKPKGKNYAGKYICLAPENLVGPYCISDVDRSYKLACKIAAQVERRGMRKAYDREMQNQPNVTSMERGGISVNLSKLRRDANEYTMQLKRVDAWLLRKLKIPCDVDFNIDSPQQLGAALIKAKLADESKMGLTATGLLCTDKAAMKAGIDDPQLYATLRWRGAVGTCLQTFIRPWLVQAKANGGRVYTRWNSIRRDHAKGGGTRTGRFSSSPNLQNVPKKFAALFLQHADAEKRHAHVGHRKCQRNDGRAIGAARVAANKHVGLPSVPLRGLPNVPSVRSYIVAEKGHVLLDRDFSSQELRVLAYFEDADIAAAFALDPKLDMHQKVANDLGIPRSKAKTMNFAVLYGVGNGALAELLGVSVVEAKQIKADYFSVYPSVKVLITALKSLTSTGKPIVTWGGRQYYCEPPRWVKGRPWDFAYKLLNYLIQGSAADLTKQTMIELHKRIPDIRILATVHDEFLVSAPKAQAKRTMEIMRKVMSINWLLNVPMLSTGKRGSNWAAMKGCA